MQVALKVNGAQMRKREPTLSGRDHHGSHPTATEAAVPEQHQERPGIEQQMQPRPEYQAPLYKGSGQARGQGRADHRRRLGIGRAVAVLYAREGADVAIVHLPEEQTDADETTRAVEGEGRRALSIPGDVRDPGFAARPSSGPSASSGSWMCW